MARHTHRCLACGHCEDINVRGGDHPPCTVCAGDTEYLWTGTPHAIETDERFIGGYVVHNLGHEPVTVYSRQELAQVAEARGLVQRIRWVPGDHYLTNLAAGMDPQTLANATALVSRQNPPSDPDPTTLPSWTPYIGPVRK